MFLILTACHAQDLTFTNLYFNKTILNPAFVGQNGEVTLNLISRQQWSNLPERGLSDMASNTFNIEAGCPKQNLSMGFMMRQSVEGAGRFQEIYGAYTIAKTFNGVFPNNIGIEAFRNRNFIFSAGLQLGYGQKSIDWSQFTFSDQYDPFIGLIKPSSLAVPLGHSSNGYLDISAGLLFKSMIFKDRAFFTTGASIFHINAPTETFLYSTNAIPPRLNIQFVYHQRVKSPLFKQKYDYLVFAFIRDVHYNSKAAFAPILSSTLLTAGFVSAFFSVDIGTRLADNNLGLNAISLSTTLQINEQLNISLAAETPPFINRTGPNVNDLGITFDIGISYAFKDRFLCKAPKKEWCYDIFTKESIKFGPRKSIIRQMP